MDKTNIEDPSFKKELLRIVWDYDIDEETLLRIFKGELKTFSLSREKLCSRLLVSTPWYRLVDRFGIKGLQEILTEDVIHLIWMKDLRDKFFYAKKALHGLS